MAKNNKLPPKNAAAKVITAKAKSNNTVAKTAKPAKASTVSKSATPTKTTAKKTAPVVVKAAKAAPVKPAAAKIVAAPAKVAVKVAPKVAVAPAKSQPQKAAPAKAPVKTVVPPVAAKPAAALLPAATAAQAPQQRAMPANGNKLAGARISSPVPAHGVAARPSQPTVSVPSKAAAQPAAQTVDPSAPKKPVTTRHGFKTNELIVYPAHGVGRIVGIEEQEIAGISLELFVIEFEKDKMTLRVPTSKLVSVGMRKLAEDGVLKRAMETLKGKARIKRTMWSRRAQEYEAKINSGDLVSIAEVVRDLYRSEAQPEQSYSERQLYEAALDRMSRELAAVDRSDERSAMQRITEILAKSAKGRRAVEEAQAASPAEDGEVQAA